MRDFVHFFIVFTLLEIAFTVFYFLLIRRMDFTIATGVLLYAGAMAAAFFSNRNAAYKKHKQDLLDALP